MSVFTYVGIFEYFNRDSSPTISYLFRQYPIIRTKFVLKWLLFFCRFYFQTTTLLERGKHFPEEEPLNSVYKYYIRKKISHLFGNLLVLWNNYENISQRKFIHFLIFGIYSSGDESSLNCANMFFFFLMRCNL